MRRNRIVCLILALTVFTGCCASGSADTLKLPENPKILGEEASFGDGSPETVVLPEGLESSEGKAFAESGVPTVNPGDLRAEIAEDAFDGTPWIRKYGEQPDGTVVITGYNGDSGRCRRDRQLCLCRGAPDYERGDPLTCGFHRRGSV